MSKIKDILFEQLNELAYQEGDFTLSSGQKSKHYFNTKPVFLNYEGALAFSSWVLGEILMQEQLPIAVGGPELGAIPMACSVMCFCYPFWKPTSFIIRKQAKGHGVQKRIEGILAPGDRVVLVEDVITTGTSLLEAIKVVEEEGCEVVRLLCLMDRQAETNPEFEAYRPLLSACFTLEEFLQQRKEERR